jgi:antitoxin PrlF
MPTATMTSKGQFTMPAEMRAKLRLVPGSKVDFVEQADGSYALKTRTGDIRRLKGIIKYNGPPVTLEDIDAGIAAAVAARLQHCT